MIKDALGTPFVQEHWMIVIISLASLCGILITAIFIGIQVYTKSREANSKLEHDLDRELIKSLRNTVDGQNDVINKQIYTTDRTLEKFDKSIEKLDVTLHSLGKEVFDRIHGLDNRMSVAESDLAALKVRCNMNHRSRD